MTNKLKYLLIGWMAHLSILFLSIDVFNYLFHRHREEFTFWEYSLDKLFHQQSNWVILIFIFLVEFNYQFVLKRAKLMMFVIACLATAIITLIFRYVIEPNQFETGRPRELIEHIIITGGYTLCYCILRDYIHTLKNKKSIQLQQIKLELDTLKAQLNPHFLFNSLNYLYGTALKEKAEETADGIDRLAEMMRYTITGVHQNFVRLKDELTFLRHFIAMQSVRLPEKKGIIISVEITQNEDGLQIAPLLLLPFIENAFKYGISIDEPCSVSIAIRVANQTLSMYVKNSIVTRPISIEGNHIAIKNTVKRLNLLYPNNYVLTQTNEDKTFTTSLQLTLIK